VGIGLKRANWSGPREYRGVASSGLKGVRSDGIVAFYELVVGAFIVVSMQNYLAQFGESVTVIQGVVFVACVLAFRRGIVGELAARAKISL